MFAGIQIGCFKATDYEDAIISPCHSKYITTCLQYCLNGDYICCKTHNMNLNTLRFLRCYRIFGDKAQSNLSN